MNNFMGPLASNVGYNVCHDMINRIYLGSIDIPVRNYIAACKRKGVFGYQTNLQEQF